MNICLTERLVVLMQAVESCFCVVSQPTMRFGMSFRISDSIK